MGLHQASAVLISCAWKGKTEKSFSFWLSQFYYLNYRKGFLKQSLVISLGIKASNTPHITKDMLSDLGKTSSSLYCFCFLISMMRKISHLHG